MAHPILEARNLGQGIWQDELRRGMMTSGELKALVYQGLSGITANPTIFEKAIGQTGDYDREIKNLVGQGVFNPKDLYERVAIEDIQQAADLLRPVYEETRGRDGFVSFEVSPALAYDTQGTIAEARRFCEAIGRENLMIKVPGTPQGFPAVAALTGEGININITLLFGLEAYRAAAEAYMEGLDRWTANGGDPSRVASVASFFISRIDTAVDERVSTDLKATKDSERRKKLKSLLGKAALANAKIAYTVYQELIQSKRWRDLAGLGARTQRVLWASTSTKNPKYPNLMYVEELIGRDTVNTMPADTLREFIKKGKVRETLPKGLEEARRTMETLADVGISIREVTDSLVTKGVKLFAESLEKLERALEKKCQANLYELGKLPMVDAEREPVSAAWSGRALDQGGSIAGGAPPRRRISPKRSPRPSRTGRLSRSSRRGRQRSGRRK